MKILHVDDEADIRSITELSLQLDPELGVVSAESASAALSQIDRCRPDLVLLDVMMPETDGPDLLEILRRRPETAAIPVIFMTAAAQRDMIDDLISFGAIGVITKPFDPMSLAKEVRKLVVSSKTTKPASA